MNTQYDQYTSPLAARNASPRMLQLWSPRHKFQTWRRIWLALAKSQHALGLPVQASQVAQLEAVVAAGITDAQLLAAEHHERDLRHDVMAHVHALGDVAPDARGIIHLGLTSQDVVCNADLLILDAAIDLIHLKVVRCIISLGECAQKHAAVPTLGFTHYQPAQPVTVGRRIAGWAFDLEQARQDLAQYRGKGLTLRGIKGATGTQASFLALCNGDAAKVDALEAAFLKQFGREPSQVFTLTGQTYPRLVDAQILSKLATIAAILHKIGTDIRLLCNRKEIDEPFESKQIGSSAMPYKRNPMRCERMCGLARFVINLTANAFDTAATQWLERTLDDSSNRRLSLPESFLALDGALDILHNVSSGLIVHEATVRKNLMDELPFMATENLLMACVQAGGDRQLYHEAIRVHAQAAGLAVKEQGRPNDLLMRLRDDPGFHTPALRSELDWDGLLDPAKYTGRSEEQTLGFVRETVEPLRATFAPGLADLVAPTLRV